ncbi:N,N-dimethylaniline monooxygenase KNAG_0E00770 [Huiozyma naganishii CBS 8797]|uniref:FAD/NAD(P)-binding domain-containing protein n=1 Tax=Huiozyma naganishii (strain ATCC MYA-139 / BCRC 22969 / CBS 8797 / KCTC 17520 / NBRC 10181 / NCYC 3082 / Yp74L-3) TaxID=1071383 RepID=J7R662_HUIN7|nr:hypothetical protein KNAG_0E00770 [Kazachstania naganishii CBS 8797]CCK70345.1 hypothetical protein KNAG_0E00770 [Kazachstania naganishii CBS 8797]
MTITEVKKLAIIGGGPGGLASARVFLKNARSFSEIHLYVSDERVGGLWYVPEGHQKGRVMYDHLETNLTKPLMQFSGFPFKEEVSEYPKRLDVYNYLQDYFTRFIAGQSPVQIHWTTPVESVLKESGKWSVRTSQGEVAEFDNVIVATGHFSKPYIPRGVRGLEDWFAHKAAIHARDFQNAEFSRDKTVVVIGNASSGQDIVNQVSSVAKHVYHSVSAPSESDYIYAGDPVIEQVGKIASVDLNSRSVTLEDGTVISGVDYLVYATGYLYNFPLLPAEWQQRLLVDEGRAVHGLWGHISPPEDPSIAFVLIPQLIIPFPLAELQAALIVHIFEGTISPQEQAPGPFDSSVVLDNLKDVAYYRWLQEQLDAANGRSASVSDPVRAHFEPVWWDAHHESLRASSSADKRRRNDVLHDHTLQLRSQGKSYTNQ